MARSTRDDCASPDLGLAFLPRPSGCLCPGSSSASPASSPDSCGSSAGGRAWRAGGRARLGGGQRQSASQREKLRMRRLAQALHALRRYLPASLAPAGQSLTKIETLRLAIRYIGHLSELLGQESRPPPPRLPLPAARPAAGGVLARRSRLPELQTRRPSRRRAPPGRAARRAPVARLPESPRRAALLPGGLLPAGGSRPGLTQPRSPAAAAAEEAPRARRTERRALWADWQRPPEGPRAGTGFRAGPERLTGSGGPLALRGAARPGEDRERPPAERVPGRPSGR